MISTSALPAKAATVAVENPRLSDEQRAAVRRVFMSALDARETALDEDRAMFAEWNDGRMDGMLALLVHFAPGLDGELGCELQRLKTVAFMRRRGWTLNEHGVFVHLRSEAAR